MNLMTLKGLEAIAEKEFEEQTDKWVRAIAEREGIGFDELRPYLVSLHYKPNYLLEATFFIPDHTPIKLFSDYTGQTAALEDGKLVGNYEWYTSKTMRADSDSFYGVKDLGRALLLARWAYEQG